MVRSSRTVKKGLVWAVIVILGCGIGWGAGTTLADTQPPAEPEPDTVQTPTEEPITTTQPPETRCGPPDDASHLKASNDSGGGR